MFFPCACCSTPTSISALHAWVYDHPVCSAECLARGENLGLFPAPPSREEAFTRVTGAIDRTYACLLECGRGEVALGQALRAHATDAAVVGFVASGVAGPLGRAFAGAAVEDRLERWIAHQEDALWTLQQELSTLIRSLMMLHGLGYPVVPKMTPLVTDFANFESVGAEELVAQLHALRALIEDLGREVHVWLRAT